jgi:hypothetical protein
LPNFERYSRDLVPLRREPWVTVQKRGIVSLNRSAYELLDQPAAVDLLYAVDSKIIGLRKTDTRSRDAHFLRSPSGKGAGPYVISTVGFMKHYQIACDASRRWLAYVEDDTLCIDLRSPGIAVTSNRAKPSVRTAT